ncbi:hypothetical protein [Runella slithyformis]|uniref:Putative phage metallopeptidase domain-containing protein n=1 Tax=Runella slithyformis (strain ATCC 29530 / DSM 19594 / LMG 11500 / NCIMB 11436 / LSU 4) TaxID=761193 RepID=A0A7U3ZJN4_RUNSL|nr:hypothetical protein [Runella slithyformis]AEI48398.1 hypothetical protein Runsl_1980 [Runella slithyformis DSM 19594]
MIKRCLILLCLIGCLGSCKKEATPEYRVPAEVEPYVQAFVREAKLRGIDLMIDNLIVEFAQPDANYICGMCNGVKARQKHIILGIQEYCWKEATPQTREGLVFHELAHCYLARLHTSKKFADGTYASLMNPDNTEVYSVCLYPIDNGNDCDKRSRRPYYIDELFDETTPPPAWAK